MFLFPAVSSGNDLVVVTHVYDGDTIHTKDGRRIRLIGLNAPEVSHPDKKGLRKSAEPFGKQSKEYLKKLLIGRKVYVKTDIEQKDHYHRFLAYLFLPDGTFINEKILDQGLAYCLPRKPNLSYEKRLLKAQHRAMQNRNGIWNSIFNKSDRTTCLGNRRTKRFHVSSCESGQQIRPINSVTFQRMWDAFSRGYAPCRKCIALQ